MINNLPLEILDMILQLCDHCDLKALRLTNRSFSTPILRYLFRNIKITTHPQDFEFLPKIARHPEIRKYVREFEYDTRMIEIDFELGLCDDVEESHISLELHSMSVEQRRALEVWGLFMRFGSDIDDAKEIKLSIARFPALQHVTLYSGTGPFGPPTDFMESMNDMQKLLLFLGIAPPNASGGWETNNARTMALFRSLSAVRQPLRSMTLHGMNWDFLSGCTKSEIKQLHLQIKQLHILNVAIKVPLDEDSDMVPRHIDSFRCIKRAANLMGEFLASATNLETLTLTFLQVDRQQSIDLRDVGSFPIEVHRLVIEGIIAQNAHSPAWPNLKNLALNNITFEYPDTLERLIQSSSKSLKRLRMSNIHLMLGNWLCTLRLIPNLFPTHNLEKFILSHEITSDYEHWDVKPRERGSSCPENCLRDKIEQWVEDGGDKCGRPFPLLPEYVPQCQMHFYPSPTRLRELREMTLQHLRAGDRSFVWRYDYLLESTVFNVDRYCPPDCCYRFSSHEESPMDIIEGACFDIAEVYDDYHFQNNNPFRYAIEDLEYIGLSSQEIGWRGMFEFDPKVDCRFMCNMREGLAKMVTST